MDKICFIPVNRFDIYGLKNWLNMKSKMGYKLLRIYNNFAVFEKNNKKTGYYFILPKGKNENSNNDNSCSTVSNKDIELGKDIKLDYICDNNQICVYYSENKNYNINQLHKKYRDNLLYHYKQTRKSFTLSLIILFIFVTLGITAIVLYRQPLIHFYWSSVSLVLSLVAVFINFFSILVCISDYVSIRESLAYFNNDYTIYNEKVKKRNIKHGIYKLITYLFYALLIISPFLTGFEYTGNDSRVFLLQLDELDDVNDAKKVSTIANYKINQKSIFLEDKYIAEQFYRDDDSTVKLSTSYFYTYSKLSANQLVKELKEEIFYSKGPERKLSVFRIPQQDKNLLTYYEEKENYIYARDNCYQYLLLRNENKVVLYTYNGNKKLQNYINTWTDL